MKEKENRFLFGENLRRILTAKKMITVELAKRTGYSQGGISRDARSRSKLNRYSELY